jgi:hypothetical protein
MRSVKLNKSLSTRVPAATSGVYVRRPLDDDDDDDVEAQSGRVTPGKSTQPMWNILLLRAYAYVHEHPPERESSSNIGRVFLIQVHPAWLLLSSRAGGAVRELDATDPLRPRHRHQRGTRLA